MRQQSSFTVVFVLWIAGLCAGAQFAKVGLVLPELGVMYPNATTSLGFLVSSISIIGALLGLLAGTLAVKHGLRNLLLTGLLIGSLVSLFQSIGLSITLLLASRIVEGCAHLAIVVSAPTLVALNSNNRTRAAAMTLWGSFFGVSYALTGWLGLPLVEDYGVNTLFFTHGALMASVTLLVFLVVPKNRTDVTRHDAKLSISSTILQRHKSAWSSPFVSAPAAGWLFYTLTFVALLAVLPGIMPPENRGFFATALPLASILSSMTLGILLLQWQSAVTVVKTGLAGAICSAIALVFMPQSLWPSIALFASLGLVQGGSFAAVPQLNKSSSDQALANGTLAQAGNIGNALGTPLLLMLLTFGGLNAVISMVAICYAAAFCVQTVLAKRRKMHMSRNLQDD